jgi:PST family polysaccharide transporter
MTRTVGAAMARGGVLSVARLVTGLVRVKVVALALGANGVGVYALLLQLYVTAVAVTSMSLAVPIINLGRRHVVAGEFEKAGSLAGTALALVAVNWAIVALVATVFGGALFAQLGVSESPALLWPIVLAVMFGAVANAFWEGLSYVCDRFDAYVRVGVIAAVAEMLVIAAAASLYGLRGAVLAMPVGPAVMCVAYWLSLRRDETVRRLLATLTVRVARLPQLLGYSALMFGAVAATNVGLTFLRSRVLVDAGRSANGYLQVATSLAAYVLSFVMTGFWGHMHPRGAEAGDTPEARAELDGAFRIGLLIAFTGCGAAAVLADQLIPIFYSGDFLPAAQLMAAYMPGELAFQLLSMLIAYQLTVSLRRRYLAWNVGYVAVIVAAGFWLIPPAGGLGYALAHNIAAIGMLAVAAVMGWQRGQLRGAIVAWSVAAIAILACVCAGLFGLRSSGALPAAAYVLLVPFVLTGLLALRTLIQDWRTARPPHRAASR